MRATEICKLQINGTRLGFGGRESGVGEGEASIVNDPGVQWEIEVGAGRVTQLFAADTFMLTPGTRRTHCVSLTRDLRPETGEIGDDSPIFRLFSERGSL